MYDHWVVFNMMPNLDKIAENTVPQGLQGRNTGGKNQYVGPCPPDREHRYFFKLYALDKMLDLHAGVTKSEVEDAMKGHIIAECKLMGRYEKNKGY
jgi:Raf kinase inhibitor-like YbhB/YbcL family protein